MFTGIIESLGKIKNIRSQRNNRVLSIQSSFASEIKVSNSISVNGCCLTVINKEKDSFLVEAVPETLKLTNLGKIRAGQYVNLERARLIGDRLDGHIVQGHIDEVAKITNLKNNPAWVEIEIRLSKIGSTNLIEKGSIAVDGISLTVAKIRTVKFTVNIIPFTYEHTNLKYKRIGDWVNLEFDLIGKYVRKYRSQRNPS
jgi:riboflavin synthase